MKVIDTGAADAAENMAFAEHLLRTASCSDQPIVHLFSWKGVACTHGVLVTPETLLNLEACRAHQVQIARRPTGGGVMFHVEDVSCSWILPACHSVYHRDPDLLYPKFNRGVADAIHRALGVEGVTLALENAPAPNARVGRFCMATPTKWDLLWQGRKVAGPALRITRKGLLYQLSITLQAPSAALVQACAHDSHVWTQMEQHSGALAPDADSSTLRNLRQELHQQLQRAFAEVLQEATVVSP